MQKTFTRALILIGGCLCFIWVIWTLLITPVFAQLAGVALEATTSGSDNSADHTALVHRREYRLALKDLSKNRITDFKRRQSALADYSLAPYLEYHYQRKRIDSLSSREMTAFMQTYADYPFAEHLRNRWLLRLPGKGRWNDYLNNYTASSSATRRCYHLRALYRSGERKAALDLVEPLWVQGKSQPKACDSLFKTWIDAGYLDDRIVWQRIVLALEKNEVTLAKYLRTLLTTDTFKRHGRAIYDAHVRPQTRFKPDAHTSDNEINRAVLSAGLLRLARKDPAKALEIWSKARSSHSFTDARRAKIESRLYIEAAEEKIYPALNEQPTTLSDPSLERIAREAVRQQNWPEASRWIAQMSEATQTKSEWRYWLIQSLNNNKEKNPAPELAELAAERNYYGFLAAHSLDLETQLNHVPSNITDDALIGIGQLPGFERSLELYAVDDLINAKREWLRAFADLSANQKAAAALFAQQRGWLDQAIVAANAAGLHNDLDLRFPQVFEMIYGKAGHATDLSISTLLAVTRQESAFADRARSSANARGLMQLLPATAKRTAKKAGLRQPTTLDLYEPAINIRIASEYLAALMERYDQQRPLAFAAYNAGEHRVDRWIKDRKGMPMEVWIETIPFRETRGYVKSVLAFNHLYSKRLNKPIPLLLPHEQAVK